MPVPHPPSLLAQSQITHLLQGMLCRRITADNKQDIVPERIVQRDARLLQHAPVESSLARPARCTVTRAHTQTGKRLVFQHIQEDQAVREAAVGELPE